MQFAAAAINILFYFLLLLRFLLAGNGITNYYYLQYRYWSEQAHISDYAIIACCVSSKATSPCKCFIRIIVCKQSQRNYLLFRFFYVYIIWWYVRNLEKIVFHLFVRRWSFSSFAYFMPNYFSFFN